MKYGDVIRVKYMQFLTQKSRLNRKYDKVVFFFLIGHWFNCCKWIFHSIWSSSICWILIYKLIFNSITVIYLVIKMLEFYYTMKMINNILDWNWLLGWSTSHWLNHWPATFFGSVFELDLTTMSMGTRTNYFIGMIYGWKEFGENELQRIYIKYGLSAIIFESRLSSEELKLIFRC